MSEHSLPKLDGADLRPWMDKEEMIKACAEQLKKDLDAYGLDIRFSGNAHTAWKELFSQLLPFIGQCLKQPAYLAEILYRIDVREEWVERAREADEPYADSLCRLILWRELQKVVTRKLLS